MCALVHVSLYRGLDRDGLVHYGVEKERRRPLHVIFVAVFERNHQILVLVRNEPIQETHVGPVDPFELKKKFLKTLRTGGEAMNAVAFKHKSQF